MDFYVIESDHSNVPLAEIRTNGRNIDWVIDNTNGKLSQMAQGSFEVLKQFIDNSSHLKMGHPEDVTVGLLRYSLENGDIVEITTDGKTCMLNGDIMAEEEKHALMGAINSGKIRVKNKADITRPIPFYKKPREIKKQSKSSPIEKSHVDAILRGIKKQEARESNNTRQKDVDIDSMDFKGSDNPALVRNLLYLLKYGDSDA